MLPAVRDPAESLETRTRGGGDDALDRDGIVSVGGGDAAREARDPRSTLLDMDLLRRGFCTLDNASIWS